jgi:hypothetical protein
MKMHGPDKLELPNPQQSHKRCSARDLPLVWYQEHQVVVFVRNMFSNKGKKKSTMIACVDKIVVRIWHQI